MKKIEMSDREREILLSVNQCSDPGVSPEAIAKGDEDAVRCIMSEAWKMPQSQLWDLGVGKFKIALMYAKFFDDKSFAINFLPKKNLRTPQRGFPFFSGLDYIHPTPKMRTETKQHSPVFTGFF